MPTARKRGRGARRSDPARHAPAPEKATTTTSAQPEWLSPRGAATAVDTGPRSVY